MSDERGPLQVGDAIPTMVFDEDDNLVAAVMAVVVQIGNGEVEISYPDGQREIIRDSEPPSSNTSEARGRCHVAPGHWDEKSCQTGRNELRQVE